MVCALSRIRGKQGATHWHAHEGLLALLNIAGGHDCDCVEVCLEGEEEMEWRVV